MLLLLQIHAYQALTDGLLATFDKALPIILLYRQERAQVSMRRTIYSLARLHIKSLPDLYFGLHAVCYHVYSSMP